MMKDKMHVVARLRERIKPENRIFVKKNLSISEQVSYILDQKNWTQKQFAEKLHKEQSEVSKLLSGLHNLTLQSISNMEAVLGEDIITTPLEACKKYSKVHYAYFTVYVNAKSKEELKNDIYTDDAGHTTKYQKIFAQ